MSDIDFVVTWVDCNDAKWQEQYANYKGTKLKLEGEDGARYRENNMFKYWFRAVEKYAPWVRKIHLITADQKPEWLNVNHEKLNLVSHKDYVPEQYLPTFNSRTIELNIHRIQELSEKFVLFSDDCFLNGKMNPNFYFKDNLPCDALILKPIDTWNIDDLNFTSTVLKNTAIINKNFVLKDLINKKTNKFYSLKYSSRNFKNYFYNKYNQYFIGFDNPHLPQPFLKKTFYDLWNAEQSILDSTCYNKFRTSSDVNQFLFRYWQLASGEFNPINPRKLGKCFNMTIEETPNIIKSLYSDSCKQICINDTRYFNSIEASNSIIQVFESKFPEKSSFEI